MIEAVKFWNEPNNKSHWAFEIDPEWRMFGEMVKLAASAVKAENPGITRVLGGMSPIDPHFINRLKSYGALDDMNAVAVHGFPLDWNLWNINQWPEKIAEIEAVTNLPIWVTEVGISTFGAEEVQEFGLRRTAELLKGVCHGCIGIVCSICRRNGKPPPGTGSRGIFLLPAFLPGIIKTGWYAKTCLSAICRLYTRVRHLPVVSF